jgi:iron(III) transport system ATP-binding protein
LLDEPLSNLDAKLRNEMREEIRRICDEFHLTTVYVTHDQKEALSIADRIAVFSKGKIEQIGTPLELYKRPQNRFVASFIGETNVLEGKVVRVGAGEAFVHTALGDFRGTLSDYDQEPSEGATVYISIRPESIRLENNRWDENAVDGRIGRTTYFGEVAHYEFIKNGVALRISELNPCHLSQSQRRGLYACVLPEDVVIFNK